MEKARRTHLLLVVEIGVLLVMVAKDDRPRDLAPVHERRELHDDRLRVPRRFLPVQLIAAKDDEVGLGLVEGSLEPLEAVDVGADVLALLLVLRVQVAALARADREVKVGDLENLVLALGAEAEGRDSGKGCARPSQPKVEVRKLEKRTHSCSCACRQDSPRSSFPSRSRFRLGSRRPGRP